MRFQSSTLLLLISTLVSAESNETATLSIPHSESVIRAAGVGLTIQGPLLTLGLTVTKDPKAAETPRAHVQGVPPSVPENQAPGPAHENIPVSLVTVYVTPGDPVGQATPTSVSPVSTPDNGGDDDGDDDGEYPEDDAPQAQGAALGNLPGHRLPHRPHRRPHHPHQPNPALAALLAGLLANHAPGTTVPGA